jgi:hypothetical protein
MDAAGSRRLEEYFRERFGVEPSTLLGLTLTAAQATVAERGAYVRVLSADGRSFGRTDDLVIHRINVEVSDGIITRVDGVY